MKVNNFILAITRDEFEALKVIPELSTANKVALSGLNLLKYGLVAWLLYKLVKKCKPSPKNDVALKGVKIL